MRNLGEHYSTYFCFGCCRFFLDLYISLVTLAHSFTSLWLLSLKCIMDLIVCLCMCVLCGGLGATWVRLHIEWDCGCVWGGGSVFLAGVSVIMSSRVWQGMMMRCAFGGFSLTAPSTRFLYSFLLYPPLNY